MKQVVIVLILSFLSVAVNAQVIFGINRISNESLSLETLNVFNEKVIHNRSFEIEIRDNSILINTNEKYIRFKALSKEGNEIKRGWVLNKKLICQKYL